MTTVRLDVALESPLPQSPDAERAVLGSILTDAKALYRVQNISAEDFFKDANRVIFVAAAQVAEEGGVVDLLTVKEHLAKRGMMEMAGGSAYISSLTEAPPDVANVERYAEIVERMSKKRKLIVLGNALMRDALDPITEPADIAANALAALSAQATTEDSQARPLVDVLTDAYDKQRALVKANKSVALDCGWETLNNHKVFHPTFIVCTAKRGSGKSALMTALSSNLAANGHPNGMLSLESTPNEIGLRYTSAVTGISHSMMRDWRSFSDGNHANVGDCLRDASRRPIFIGKGPRTFEAIILEIKRLRAMHGIEAVFVDYIQLIRSTKRFERNELMFAHISQEFLATAIDSRVSICAFSQVNKDGDVAYADSIEQSARVRLHFEREDGQCQVDFKILKNNEERTNSFPAHFDEITQRFTEGTCEQNNCRTVRKERPRESDLFRNG